jgi:hypothetical protein
LEEHQLTELDFRARKSRVHAGLRASWQHVSDLRRGGGIPPGRERAHSILPER